MLRVLYDVGRLTGNRVRHPFARRDLAKGARAAALLAYRQAGSPEFGAVRLSYVVRRGKRLDDDNALAGCKEIRDTLCRRRKLGYGLVEDDGPAYVTQGEVRQETGGKWRYFPEVEVRVEALS